MNICLKIIAQNYNSIVDQKKQMDGIRNKGYQNDIRKHILCQIEIPYYS